MSALKIIEVFPPYFEVSEDMKYGGIEGVGLKRIISMAGMGHNFVVFALEGSVINHPNVTVIHYSSNGYDLTKAHPNETIAVNMNVHALVMEYIENNSFDVILDHTEAAPAFWCYNPYRKRVIITTHNDPNRWGAMAPLASQRVPFVAISNAQCDLYPEITWRKAIHHGMPAAELLPVRRPKLDYLALLTRFDEEKGVRHALAAAKRAGMKVKIAAPLREQDRSFFEEVVQPAIDEGYAEYIGLVDLRGKQELLGNARAIMCLSTFPEPFGLMIIEAMACGTPVIGFDQGAIPELVEHGKTGYVCHYKRDQNNNVDIDEVVEAIRKVDVINRGYVRERFRVRFTDTIMAKNWVRLCLEVKRMATKPKKLVVAA